MQKIVKGATKRGFNQEEDVVIFTHIPKCAGTPLHYWLTNALDGKYLHFVPGSWKDGQLENLLGGGGHQEYGANPLVHTGKNTLYVSVMREPYDRFVSFYKHVASHRDHHLHRYYIDDKDPLRFAMRLFNDGDEEIANLQTAMLAGGRNRGWEAAAENIHRNYSLVGCVEFIGEFYRELGGLLGVEGGCASQRRRNVSEESANLDFLLGSPELERYVYATNDDDCQLYSYLFEL